MKKCNVKCNVLWHIRVAWMYEKMHCVWGHCAWDNEMQCHMTLKCKTCNVKCNVLWHIRVAWFLEQHATHHAHHAHHAHREQHVTHHAHHAHLIVLDIWNNGTTRRTTSTTTQYSQHNQYIQPAFFYFLLDGTNRDNDSVFWILSMDSYSNERGTCYLDFGVCVQEWGTPGLFPKIVCHALRDR